MPTNIQKQLALYQHLIDGLKKHLASATEVAFQSASYKPAALIQVLQDLVDAGGAVAAARTAFHDAITAFREKVQAARPVVRGLRNYILSLYKDAATLADFGLVPRKPPKAPLTTTAAEALAKRKATRVARHTMGRRQKLAIKGTVPAPASNGATNGTGGTAEPATGTSSSKAATSGPTT